MANDVTFTRDEYDSALPRWQLVNDCCDGSRAVKDKTTDYLPRPNPLDISPEADQRYKDYVRRAVFYNATGRTKKGLTGLVFRIDPELKIPGTINYVADDVDGAGVSIYQQSQQVLGAVLRTGRDGLLVDYPKTGGVVSKADMQNRSIRATITRYAAERVTNWRTEKVGGKHMLSLVVLHEWEQEVTPDGFGLKSIEQYRVLKLVDGIYTVEIYRKNNKDQWVLFEPAYQPTKSNGQKWKVIPFAFVGAENNDHNIDGAPLYDLAELNIAHYRNSAEYEDTVFMCGQVQPVVTGIDENWVKLLKEQGLKIGSRTLFPLPKDATFSYTQAEPNTLPSEAMRHKEEQMISLGAQLLTKNRQQKTATEVDSDTATNTSVLSQIAANVSEAYSLCLAWVGEFMGATGEMIYKLNQDFIEHSLDPQMLTALIGAWQSGKLPEGDLWQELRKYGLIDPKKDNETIRDELSNQNPGLNLDDA
jgi:hypothetical protein